MTGLEITLLYLLAAVLGVVACRLLKLPPMLGYLCVGVVIGPNALALSKSVETVQHLGESHAEVLLETQHGSSLNVQRVMGQRDGPIGIKSRRGGER